MSKYLRASWWNVIFRELFNEAKSRVRFREQIIDKTVEGEDFRFYIADVTGDSWYNNANSENVEMRYIKELLLDHTSSPTVLECGAHHGLTTILLSRWVSKGRVVAFEALPHNVVILRKNLELNECANVSIVAKAVGNGNQTVRIRSRSNSAIDKKGSVTVDSISIDEYCKSDSIKPDIIKIDVEGFEIDVLEGACSVLSSYPAIFVEVHSEIIDRYGRKIDDLWKYIDRSRYEIWLQLDDRQPPVRFTGQNISARVHMFFRPLSWI